ncbi:uncharacterized protein V1513DRAFT_449652 [Lipomyces chichibuensis]|uniref:uncharacterized protein n=1 Tax=Lipomyces chichibuensis TaxID=1546026 RepID=UPI0033442A94
MWSYFSASGLLLVVAVSCGAAARVASVGGCSSLFCIIPSRCCRGRIHLHSFLTLSREHGGTTSHCVPRFCGHCRPGICY